MKAVHRAIQRAAQNTVKEHTAKSTHISFTSSLLAGFSYSGMTSVSNEEIETHWVGVCFIFTVLLSVCLSVITLVLESILLLNLGKFDPQKFTLQSELTEFRLMLSSVQAIALPCFQYSIYFFLISILFIQQIKFPFGPLGVLPSITVILSFWTILTVQNRFQHRAVTLKRLTFKGSIQTVAAPLSIQRSARPNSIFGLSFHWGNSNYKF